MSALPKDKPRNSGRNFSSLPVPERPRTLTPRASQEAVLEHAMELALAIILFSLLPGAPQESPPALPSNLSPGNASVRNLDSGRTDTGVGEVGAAAESRVQSGR